MSPAYPFLPFLSQIGNYTNFQLWNTPIQKAKKSSTYVIQFSAEIEPILINLYFAYSFFALLFPLLPQVRRSDYLGTILIQG